MKEGRSNITGDKVAIKIYEKNKVNDSAKKRCILNEIDILKKLNHKNIIKLFDVVETGTQVN